MYLGLHIVVLITVSSREEGEKIAEELVKKGLAACVNIVRDVDSIFWWEDKVNRARELILIAKSRIDKFPELVKTVKELHSYEVPEIIAIPIIAGLESYLKWIDKVLKRG